MEGKKTGIIYCPNHFGLRSQKSKRKRICDALDRGGLEYDIVQSETHDSVSRLVDMMIDNGYDTIVICGGDMALNDAVNCIMRREKEVRDKIRLGIIPNGVMNDFAAFWELTPSDIDASVAALKKGRERLVDVGSLIYTDKRGESHHRYFLNCVSVGLVASLMNMRRRTRRVFGSRTLSYISSCILMLTQRMGYKMDIVINDESIKGSIMTACFGSCRGFGQTPNGVPYNGSIDISIVTIPRVMRLLSGIKLFVSGRFLMHDGVHPYRTREEVHVQSANHAPVAVDGSVINDLRGPFDIMVTQEEIKFIIP